MPISVNATLNLSINPNSIKPAFSAIEREFQNKKIPLQVELQIPKNIDKEIYRVSNAFRVLDDRMRSLKFSSSEALGGIQAFIKEISGGANNVNKNLTPAVKSLDQTAKSITSVAKSAKIAKDETTSLAEAVGVSAKRFLSFAIAAGAIANVAFQFQKGVHAALEFDRELVKLKQVGGDSQSVIQSISDEVSRLSKTFGVSSGELIKVATTLRQAGLSAADTKVALDSLAKTTLAPTFDSIGNTTEGVIAILAQFKQGVGSLEKQLGSINRVAADYAVESGDLVEAIRRTGGAFQAAGGNLEELLALFTSVRATTRESAESIATAFRTIFARLQRPDTLKNLDAIGVKLTDLQGRFIGPFKAVQALHEALADLPTTSGQFAQIVEEIGGIRQISKVIPLIQQAPLAVEAYNTALKGQESLSKDAAIAQEAFVVQINKLKESFLDLFRVVSSNDFFKAFLGFLISSTKLATDMLAAFKPLVPILSSIAAIKIGSALFGAGPAFTAGFKKRGFATGGVVPVTPNTGVRSGTDTVPALLTEGEYVINRSSAKAIGYDTLDQLNAYATGGVVSLKNPNKAAMLTFTNREQDARDTATVVVPKHKLKGDLQGLLGDADAVSGTFTVAGPSSVYQNNDVHERFKNAVKQSIATIAKKAFRFDVGGVDDSIYDKVIDKNGQGRLFEAVLQSIAKTKDVPSNNEVFDFPNGVSGDLAAIFPGATGKIGDAKLSDNRDSRINMISKMLRSPLFGVASDTGKTYQDFRDQYDKNAKKFPVNKERARQVSGLDVIPRAKGHAHGGKIQGFARGGLVGGMRTYAKGSKGGVSPFNISSFDTSDLERLFTSFGLKISNLVDKINLVNNPYTHNNQLAGGHFDPSEKSITARSGDLTALFHEIGHAVDYNNTNAPQKSSAGLESINKYIAASQKGGLLSKTSILGNSPLSAYGAESHPEEAFANLFAAHSAYQGVKSGAISQKDLPQILQQALSNKDLRSIVKQFGDELGVASPASSRVSAPTGVRTATIQNVGPLAGQVAPPARSASFNVSGQSYITSNPQPKNNLKVGTDTTLSNNIIDKSSQSTADYYKSIGIAVTQMKEGGKKLKDGVINFAHDFVEGQGKLVATIIKEGKEFKYVSKNNYNAKTAIKRENRLTEGGFGVDDLIAGKGGFQLSSVTDTSKFGKIRSALGKIGPAALTTAAFAAPYVSQQFLGTAEKPGVFGETGSKIGAGLSGAVSGGGFGAAAGSTFGPLGTAIGGFVGAIAGAITSVKNFSKEVDDIKIEKLSKSVGNVDRDVVTGKLKGTSESLATIGSSFNFEERQRIAGLYKPPTVKELRDEPTFNPYGGYAAAPRPNIEATRKKIEEDNQAAEAALKEKVERSGILSKAESSLRARITARPGDSVENLGKFGGGTESLLGGSGLSDLGILKKYAPEAAKAIEKLAVSTAKLNEVQNKAFEHLRDLNTALDVFSKGIDIAGENFKKNTNLSNFTSEALGGKASAGVTAPQANLFGPFGKALESFAKPGGELDSARKNISDAIKLGIEKQASPNEGDREKAADIAADAFKKGNSSKNPFTKDIAEQIKSVLSASFANPGKDVHNNAEEVSALSDQVTGKFSNVVQTRNQISKQFEEAFNVYSQQIGQNAERLNAAQQKRAEIQNRGTNFGLANAAAREEISGLSGTEFSQTRLNQLAVQGAVSNRSDQLEALGIDRNAGGKDIRQKITSTRLDLEDAVNKQKTAQESGDFKAYNTATQSVVELSNTLGNLKKGLDLLATSTDVLAAKQKIATDAIQRNNDEIKGNRDDSEILRFGTAQEKMELLQKEQLTQYVLEDPSRLDYLPDEAKKKVQQRLHETEKTRVVPQFDYFGRQRGFRAVSSSDQLNELISPVFNQLNNSAGARFRKNNALVAQRDLELEQTRLQTAGGLSSDLDIDTARRNQANTESNFTKYIEDISSNLTKNAEIFKTFSDAVNNLAHVLVQNPIPNEIILKNDSNVNINLAGANIAGQLTEVQKREVQEQVRLALVKNNVITDKTPARA
jgi:hypothetical protein